MTPKVESRRVAGDCHECSFEPLLFYTTGSCGEAAELAPLRRGSRVLPPRSTIYRAGDAASEYFTLFEGWAFRYKLLPDGRRQILSFLLPGDSISFQLMRSDRMGFSVQALTETSLCVFDRRALADYVSARPTLAERLDRLTAREIAAADDRLTDLGCRSAHERIAGLMLQLHGRLQLRDAIAGRSFVFPLRQQHIGDALGLTAVHVSRVLKDLKVNGLARIEQEKLTILDLPMLRKLAGQGDDGCIEERLHIPSQGCNSSQIPVKSAY